MAQINLIFQHDSDDVAPDATLSVNTGTEDTDYPKANLVTRNPAKPAKLTTTTGSWVFDFTSAQRVDIVALLNHNLDAGLDVRLQGNATDSWGSPTFSAAIVIPAKADDGMFVNPWLDVTAAGGYSAGGFRYWRVAVIGTNGAAVAIGEVWLSAAIRRLSPNISVGAEQRDRRRVIQHRLPSSVIATFDLGSRIRELDAEVEHDDTARDAVRAWWRDCRGRARPFLMVPDGLVNDAWFARFATDHLDVLLPFIDDNRVTLRFEEVASGLPL